MAGAPIRKAHGGLRGPFGALLFFVFGLGIIGSTVNESNEAEEARRLLAQGRRVEATVAGLHYGRRGSSISLTYPVGNNVIRTEYARVGREVFESTRKGQTMPVWYNPANPASFAIAQSGVREAGPAVPIFGAALCAISALWLFGWWRKRRRGETPI